MNLKLANHPTNASMNSAITSADNAVLHSSTVALRTTPADVDQKIAALLPLVAQMVLDAALAIRRGGPGFQSAADVAAALATALTVHGHRRAQRTAGRARCAAGRARRGDSGPARCRAVHDGGTSRLPKLVCRSAIDA